MNRDMFFKNIKVGGLSNEELVLKLSDAGVEFNEYAKTLLDSSYFKVEKKIETVSLVKVNLLELDIKFPCSYNIIVESASSRGFDLCPLYLAAFLRLEFLDQPEGRYLTIASEKPTSDESYPNGFYIRNMEEKLWLRGYRADDDYLWPLESEFIFRCRTL